jgi:hypothetical protein
MMKLRTPTGPIPLMVSRLSPASGIGRHEEAARRLLPLSYTTTGDMIVLTGSLSARSCFGGGHAG